MTYTRHNIFLIVLLLRCHNDNWHLGGIHSVPILGSRYMPYDSQDTSWETQTTNNNSSTVNATTFINLVPLHDSALNGHLQVFLVTYYYITGLQRELSIILFIYAGPKVAKVCK
jgi:hypothetical protein